MFKIIVKFEVKEFEAWKKFFEGDKGPREQAGINTVDILREVENDKKIIVIFQTEDLAKAKAHLGNPDVKKGQMNAGFIAPPDVFFGKVS